MKSLAPILLILVLFSCELVTEVKVPDIPPTLVVNGVYTPDSTWFIQVAQTNNILSDHLYQPTSVNNASVVITGSDGQTATLLEKFRHSGVVNFASDKRPASGHSYTINVSAPGYESATATSLAPTAVQLIGVRLDSSSMIPQSNDTDGSIPIEFTFQDTPGMKDYYYPRFYVVTDYMQRQEDGTYVMRERWMEYRLSETVRNEILSEFQERLIEFDDKAFDGKRHTVRLHLQVLYRFLLEPDSPNPTKKRWRFFLSRAGEDYYKYFRSVRLQNQNDGNPFAQPVQIHSNVQGGLGIFAGAVTSEWKSDD